MDVRDDQSARMGEGDNYEYEIPRPSYDRIDFPENEEELKELLKRAVEAANNSIVISDPNQEDNPLIYVNQGFMALTGYDEEEILGRNCRFLQYRADGTRDDKQPDLDRLNEALDQGETCRVILRNYKKDGTMFWNELYITPVHNAEGELVNFVGVQNDVTERIQINEELEQRVSDRTEELERQRDELRNAKERAEAATRAKSTFLANMSHEIRTPLTAILGLADVMRVKSSDNRFEEHIRRIKSAGSRLMDTLSSLLTLAKLESGKMEVDLEPVCLADEAFEVVELFQARARQKGLDLSFEVTDEAKDAVARIDAGALNSALQNLISNAIKFTEEGSVHVRVRLDAETGDSRVPNLNIEVIDTGIGIGDEFKPYIFENFSQESDGLTREYDGSGLGLSITKQLVEAMDGSITAESESEQGSRFIVSFPVADVQPSAAPMTGFSHGVSSTNGEGRILLVEDDENTVFLVKNIFDDDDLHIEAATGAQEAYECVQERHYDLLIVDVNLGAGGSGVDLLQRIRELPSYESIPIVAVTAIAMPGDREVLLAEGFDDYLSKPFEAEALVSLVDRYL